MTQARKEFVLKWMTLVVSILALLSTCLRNPITLTLRATIIDELRQELGRYETIAASQARWQRQQDTANDLLNRCEQDRAAARDLAAANQASGAALLQLSNRLATLEARLDLLLQQRDLVPPSRPNRVGSK